MAALGGVLALAAVSVGPADFITPPNTTRHHLVELARDAVPLLLSFFTEAFLTVVPAAKPAAESDSGREEERRSPESSASGIAEVPSDAHAVQRAVNPQVLEVPRAQALGRAVQRAAKPSVHRDPVQTHEQVVSDGGVQAARAVQRILQERQQHRVHVYFDGEAIVLEGPVRSEADLTPSLRLAKRYGYPVVDRLWVWQRPAPPESPSPPVQPQNHERATQRQARLQNPDLLDMLFTPRLVDWDRVFQKGIP